MREGTTGPVTVDALAGVVVPDVPDDPTAGDLLRRALALDVRRLLVHDPVMREGIDPEGVHQARVATRRLRSVLGVFGSMFDPEWSQTIRRELSRIASILGSARDADVLAKRLAARAAVLPEADLSEARRLLESLETSRREAHDDLDAVLRSKRYAELLVLLIGAAKDPGLSAEAHRPAGSMFGAVRDSWEGLKERVAAASRPPSDADLHRIRIRAKKVRYSVEIVEPIAGKPARGFLADLADAQRILGEHADGVMARSWLDRWSAERGTDRSKIVAGELVGLELVAAKGYRTDWKSSWKRLESKSRPNWM